MNKKDTISSKIIADLNEPTPARYEHLLKNLLPQIKLDEDNIILAEVLLSLKMEGLVGKELNPNELELVHLLKDLIKNMPEKKQEALDLAQKLAKNKKVNKK